MTRAASDAPQTTAQAAPPRDLLTGASLFLDFDGTLVEIASRPDGVAVDARLRDLIDRLRELLDGRLAIVSGRPVETIQKFLGTGFAISGSHGLEMRWADGRQAAPPRPDGLDSATAAFHDFADDNPGVLVEEKPFGVGLHYREADSAEAPARALAEDFASRTGLALQAGKKVFELRASGSDKGRAIQRFMQSAPFAGHRPVFLGDDVTDEDGFAAVRAMGGAGVLVGAERPSHAEYRLPDVAATLNWLTHSTETI